jgi:PAS domain S-box-containing protein
MPRARLLIAEDELIVAEDMAASLSGRGYEILGMVSTAEAAITEAERTDPDLILMDVRLKGKMDGIEASARIHERCDVPIVYVSAYAEKDILERAKLTDPYGYVLKPFGERDLNKTVEMALYKHEMDRSIRQRSQELAGAVERLEREVARRKDVEKRLLEREARFSRYFRLPLVGMATMANDLTLSSVNEKLCRMLNMSTEELIGRKLEEITDKADYQAEWQYISRVLEGAAEVYTIEKTLVGKNNARAPTLSSVGSVRRSDGKVDHFVALMQDLSKQLNEKDTGSRASEDMIELLEAVCNGLHGPVSNLERFGRSIMELTKDARARIKEDSTLHLNEEIRDSLNSIIGLQIPECAEHMMAAVTDTQHRTNLLLEYVRAKTSVPIMTRVDLTELVRDKLKEMEDLVKGNNVTIELFPLAGIVSERPAIEKLVEFIIRRALALPCQDRPLKIEISGLEEVESSTIYFRTNGRYLPDLIGPEGLAHASARIGGSGLEYLFSRVWAERIGVEINLSKGTSGGAIFSITIPDRELGGLRILLVDDNPATVSLLSQQLGRIGHITYPSLSALEALEILEAHEVDLVVGDLGMPGMDGWELGKRIIDHCALRDINKIPYIVLTGWTEYPDQQKRVRESGVDEILQKPVDMEDLLRAIARTVKETSNSASW